MAARGRRLDWVGPVVRDVSQHVHALTAEVLAAVRSTEQSLSRMARPRRAADGLSDDDKIRLQLHYDVTALARAAAALGVPVEDNVSLQQALASVEACKPAAGPAPAELTPAELTPAELMPLAGAEATFAPALADDGADATAGADTDATAAAAAAAALAAVAVGDNDQLL